MISLMSVLLTLLLALATTASAYTYTTVDAAVDFGFPEATQTVVTGYNEWDEILLTYHDAVANLTHSALRTRDGCVVPLLRLTARALTHAGTVAGFLAAPGGEQGWTYHAGQLRVVIAPRRLPTDPPTSLTHVLAADDVHGVVGVFRDGVGKWRGFWRTLTGQVIRLEVTGALETTALNLSPAGRILLRAIGADGVKRHYLWEAGTVTELPPIPALADIDLVRRTESGLLIGNTGDHGFVWDGTSLTMIAFPDAEVTQIFGAREDGTVYGRYIKDGVDYGFVAIPEDEDAGARQHGKQRKHGKQR